MSNEIHTNNFDNNSQKQNNKCQILCTHSWNSIYNNFHPTRRLPSITISIVLLSFLFFTGYINTKNTDRTISNKQPNILGNIQNKDINPPTKQSFSDETKDGNMDQKTFMQITILSNN